MEELRFPTLEPSESLVFSEPEVFSDSRKVQRFQVTVHAEGIAASVVAWDSYDDGFEQLARFFEGMAADFRGWEGERVWKTAEPAFWLTARHDRSSRITLRVGLECGSPDDAWRATVPVTLDPGTALELAASGLRRFVRRPG